MTFKRIIAFSCFLGRLYGDGFHPEELILTPGGYVTAETLRPGYSVLGVDPETGALEPCTVSALFIHHDWPAVQLHLDRGPIRCAENQLFLKSDGDWVFASELVAGDQLLCEDGRIDVVAGLSFEALPIDAIGLMVEPHHTLCVGSQGIVAHNFLPLIAVPLITWTIGAEVTFLTLSTLGVAAATAATYWGLSKASYAVNRRWEPTPSYFDTYMRNGSDDYGSGSSPGGQRSSGTSNKSDPSELPDVRRQSVADRPINTTGTRGTEANNADPLARLPRMGKLLWTEPMPTRSIP